MRTLRAASVATLALVLAGCSADQPAPVAVPMNIVASHDAGTTHNFGTHLTGDAERPNPVPTRAQGQAIFRLSDDGTSLDYKLITANITNVTMAHIHCGAASGTGPIAVWLYPAAPPASLIPGRSQGVLAEGTITSVASTACGLTSLTQLMALIESGGAYVNVHTSAYGAGEIRGQL